VFAAWQRALAQRGLTAGRFYSIYDETAAIPIEDEKLRRRFEAKRDNDLGEIRARLHQVEIERAYRIIGVLEDTAKAVEERVVPAVREAKVGWRRRVLWADGIAGAIVVAVFGYTSIAAGHWDGLRYAPPWLGETTSGTLVLGGLIAVILAALGYLHFLARRLSARAVLGAIARRTDLGDEERSWVKRAFEHNAKPWRPLLAAEPAGWGAAARKRLARVLTDADRFVQTLNNRFADPSGGGTDTGRRAAMESAASSPPQATAPEPIAAPAATSIGPRTEAVAVPPATKDERQPDPELAGEGGAENPAVGSLAAASKH
jgi:hypothetical protein